jgi:ElaB/YqjD/DUF883 family membrane-anchored ribosome-binding protein
MAELTGNTYKTTLPTSSNVKSVEKNLEKAADSSGLREAYDSIQKRAQVAFHNSEDFVKQYPIRTVLGAAAVGFLAGMISRRKH